MQSDDDNLIKRCESTKGISEYMLYLLVVNPTMLSTGNQRFQKTADDSENILKGKKCKDEKQASEVLMASLSLPEGQGSTLSLLREALSCAANLSSTVDIFDPKLQVWFVYICKKKKMIFGGFVCYLFYIYQKHF